MPTYIYTLTSSHIHNSDEPDAIIFIQVLALSHRAQVINLEPLCQPVQRVTGVAEDRYGMHVCAACACADARMKRAGHNHVFLQRG